MEEVHVLGYHLFLEVVVVVVEVVAVAAASSRFDPTLLQWRLY